MDKNVADALARLDVLSLVSMAQMAGVPIPNHPFAIKALNKSSQEKLIKEMASDPKMVAKLRTLLHIPEPPVIEQRLPIDKYFMDIAFKVAERGTCLRRRVGAIAVKDKRILATGYNGAPSGLEHCLEIGCIREQMSVPSGERHELCRAVHAEQNVIVQAAKHGISLEGAYLYCTTFPCSICTKMLINCGIKEIFYVAGYKDELSEKLLNEAGIPHKVLL